MHEKSPQVTPVGIFVVFDACIQILYSEEN